MALITECLLSFFLVTALLAAILFHFTVFCPETILDRLIRSQSVLVASYITAALVLSLDVVMFSVVADIAADGLDSWDGFALLPLAVFSLGSFLLSVGGLGRIRRRASKSGRIGTDSLVE